MGKRKEKIKKIATIKVGKRIRKRQGGERRKEKHCRGKGKARTI